MKTSSTMMAIEGLTIICMLVVGMKVYMIDKFKNKYIFFLLLFLNLSIYSDFSDWVQNSKKTILRSDYHNSNNFLGFLTISFMNIALKLNLRIWISYLLKI